MSMALSELAIFDVVRKHIATRRPLADAVMELNDDLSTYGLVFRLCMNGKTGSRRIEDIGELKEAVDSMIDELWPLELLATAPKPEQVDS